MIVLSVRFLGLLLSGYDLPDADGEVRAVEFAPAATGAAFGVFNHRGAVFIQAQTLLRAEGRTNTAGFAPIPEDVDFILRLGLLGRLVSSGRCRGFVALPQFFFLTSLLIHGQAHWLISAGQSLRLTYVHLNFSRRWFGGASLLLKSGVSPNSYLHLPYSPYPRLRLRKLRSRFMPSVVMMDSG